VRVLRPIVEPASHLAVVAAAQHLQRRTIGPQPVGYDVLRAAMAVHGFPDEFQCCLAVPRLGDDALQLLAFVIDSSPKVVRHPVDLHKDLVQVPPPLSATAHRLDPLASDHGSEHRAEPVPPVAHGLLADFDSSHVQKFLNVAER
jgi:hypothetical protein